MYCKNCGKSIKETDKFCEKCGSKIEFIESKEEIANESKSIKLRLEEVKSEKMGNQNNDYLPEELRIAVKNAGESVFAIGVFSLIEIGRASCRERV